MIPDCPLCGSPEKARIFSTPSVPVLCNRLFESEADARAAASGAIELCVCKACGLIWNAAYDADRMTYDPGYENALHFSAVFQKYAEDLSAALVHRYHLDGGQVIEVGCGDGHMLDTLVRHGVRSAVGFDPSSARDTAFTKRDGVEIVPEYFEASHADRPFDLLLCRHVLEHIDEPVPFLRMFREAIGDRNSAIYIEVPNGEWLVSSRSIWDVIYEHVTYWTRPGLDRLLRRTGFQPTKLAAAYGGQFLQAEAVPAGRRATDVPEREPPGVKEAVAFGRFVDTMLEEWQSTLDALSGPAVLWGAGSKAVSFVNMVEGTDALVDLNPRKHGLRIPGTGLPVVAPEALREIRPELVVIANGLYEQEIRKQVDDLGLQPQFKVLAA